jgi:hypothetical protein
MEIKEVLQLQGFKIPEPEIFTGSYEKEKKFIHTILFSLEKSGWKFVKPSDRPDIEYADAYLAIKRAFHVIKE